MGRSASAEPPSRLRERSAPAPSSRERRAHPRPPAPLTAVFVLARTPRTALTLAREEQGPARLSRPASRPRRHPSASPGGAALRPSRESLVAPSEAASTDCASGRQPSDLTEAMRHASNSNCVSHSVVSCGHALSGSRGRRSCRSGSYQASPSCRCQCLRGSPKTPSVRRPSIRRAMLTPHRRLSITRHRSAASSSSWQSSSFESKRPPARRLPGHDACSLRGVIL